MKWEGVFGESCQRTTEKRKEPSSHALFGRILRFEGGVASLVPKPCERGLD